MVHEHPRCVADGSFAISDTSADAPPLLIPLRQLLTGREAAEARTEAPSCYKGRLIIERTPLKAQRRPTVDRLPLPPAELSNSERLDADATLEAEYS
jgi:hypothetical protein